MDLSQRLAAYRTIEEYRKKPLIIYATSTRANVTAMMAGDAVRHLIDQVDAITDSDAVDVLIHSSGGDALAAWKLMSVLRERFKQVSVLVPFMAFSAATLFALGADEIVMHPHASLGPIDPQITVTLKDGSTRHFSYEDVGAFLRFLDAEVGISEQVHIGPLVDRLFTAVDPLVIGAAKRASELSTAVGERLLRMHLSDYTGRDVAKQIAESLNKSFFAHGDAVSRSRARELNLPIAADDPVLEGLLWRAYLGLEAHMELRRAFDALQLFMAHPDARKTLEPMPALVLPINAPQPLIDGLWNHVGQQAMARLGQPNVQVEFDLIQAVMESTRIATEFRSRGLVSAVRVPGGDVQVSLLTIESGWRDVPLSFASEGSDNEAEHQESDPKDSQH